MRRVPIHALKPGQKVGKPVFNSSGQKLLNKDIILTEKYIDRLYRLGITALYIDDGFLPDIEVNDIISEKTRIETIKHVRQIMAEPKQIMSKPGVSIIDRVEFRNNRKTLFPNSPRGLSPSCREARLI